MIELIEIANPTNVVGLWVTRETSVEYDDVETRPADETATELVTEIVPSDDAGYAALEAAADDAGFVTQRDRGTYVLSLARLFAAYGLKRSNLDECDGPDCSDASARFMVFPSVGEIRQYCGEHYEEVVLSSDTPVPADS